MKKKTFVCIIIAVVLVCLAVISIVVLNFTSYGGYGKTDAQIINSRWTVDGHYYTDEERRNSRSLLNEDLNSEYYDDDGSQTINYYIFDVSNEDIDYIPFTATTDEKWEEKSEIKDVLAALSVPDDKKPHRVNKLYRLSDTEDDESIVYIWLLLSEDEEKLYVVEMLN